MDPQHKFIFPCLSPASVALSYLPYQLCTTVCPWRCTPPLWSHQHHIPFCAPLRYPFPHPASNSILTAAGGASKSGPRISTTWFTPHMYHEAILEHVYRQFSIIFSFARLIGPVGEQVNEKMGSWVTLSQKADIKDWAGSTLDREAVLKDWPPLKRIPMNSFPGVKHSPINNILF